MDGLLGTLIAVCGGVGGFLAPIIQDHFLAARMKRKIEMVELIDQKVKEFEGKFDERLKRIEDKLVTKEYLDLLVKTLKSS